MPPLARTDTCLSIDGNIAKLIRTRDGLPLMVVPREKISTDRIGRLGYANPHAALHDAYAEEFDREFLDQLAKGVIR